MVSKIPQRFGIGNPPPVSGDDGEDVFGRGVADGIGVKVGLGVAVGTVVAVGGTMATFSGLNFGKTSPFFNF